VKAGDVLRAIGAAFMAAALALHGMATLRYGENPEPPLPPWPFAVVAVETILLISGGTLFLATLGRR